MMTPTITLRQKRAMSSFSNQDEYSHLAGLHHQRCYTSLLLGGAWERGGGRRKRREDVMERRGWRRKRGHVTVT